MDRPTPVPGPAAGASAEPASEPAPVVLEPRQRWRIVFARDASDRPHREVAEAWLAGIAASELPLPRTAGRPKPALAFAAPMLSGVRAERELADLLLAALVPIADVRAALATAMPEELRLVELYDVWLGAPALAAALAAGEYRVELAGERDRDSLARCARALLDARTLERERARGGGTVRYDLRPLLDDIVVERGEPTTLRIRTRFHPARGTGRPEEVLAALGEVLGAPLTAAHTVRERLILGDDPPA